MILIDKSYHPYFQGYAKYIQSCLDQPSEITDDYSREGLWILNYASHLTRVQDKIKRKYIALQTEQMSAKGNAGYREFLANAVEVWDNENPNDLSVRVGYSIVWRLEMEAAKDIDVLFYGTINKRRKEILDQISNITIVTGQYGADICKHVMRSKIVLSTHYYPNPANDLPRIAPLLSNRAFVIAERGVDKDYNSNEGFVCVDRNDIANKVKYYLDRPVERIEWADRGFEWIRKRQLKLTIKKR